MGKKITKWEFRRVGKKRGEEQKGREEEKRRGCRGDEISIPIPAPYPYPWGTPYGIPTADLKRGGEERGGNKTEFLSTYHL